MLCGELPYVVLDGFAGQPVRDPEGPRKGSTAKRELQALRRGVQVCASAGCSSVRVRGDGEAGSLVAGDDSQQLLLGGSLPTTHAGA